MKILYLLVILIVFNSDYQVHSANILYLVSLVTPSHHIWNSIFAKQLIQNGHNVTLTSLEEDRDVQPNYTVIHFEGVTEKFKSSGNLLDSIDNTNWQVLHFMSEWWLSGCDLIYKSKGFEKLVQLDKSQSFDLIVIDISMGECLHPIVAKFGYPPTIGVSVFLLPSYVSYAFGNHLHPSYLLWHSTVNPSHNMTFTQRLINYVYTTLDNFYTPTLSQEGTSFESMVRKKFEKSVDMSNITRHISLVLANIDPVLNVAQPLTPNIIPVGGLQTRKSERKNIPKDLLEILDAATNGVILFSLGTNIKSDSLDKTKRQAFLDAFKRLSYTVVWKYESTDVNQNNVIIRKWLPQNDVLGHPNIKLFIGHGGALSTHETIFHGVPFIGVPFFGDQRANVNILIAKKAALKIDYHTANADTIFVTINEVLSNPMYSKNIKKMSELFRDQPQTPMERALFWTEYVLRHKQTPHLDSIARDLPWYISSSADVIFFLFGLLLTVIIFSTFVLRKLLFLIYCFFDHNMKKNLVKIKSN